MLLQSVGQHRNTESTETVTQLGQGYGFRPMLLEPVDNGNHQRVESPQADAE